MSFEKYGKTVQKDLVQKTTQVTTRDNTTQHEYNTRQYDTTQIQRDTTQV